MYVKEMQDAWRMTFFPNAVDAGKTDDTWPSRGFRTQYGVEQGVNVPKYIEYDKTKFTRFEAENYAKNIRTCEKCKVLNNEVDVVQSVELMDSYPNPSTGGNNSVKVELARLKNDFTEIKNLLQKMDKSPTRKSATQELATNIAMDMFKTNFTDPGRIELALIFDDDSFIDDILPESPTAEDLLELRAQMAEFWSGEIGRYRNKDQLRDYAKMQRNNIKALRGEPIDEEEEEPPKVVKKKHGNRTRVKVV